MWASKCNGSSIFHLFVYNSSWETAEGFFWSICIGRWSIYGTFQNILKFFAIQDFNFWNFIIMVLILFCHMQADVFLAPQISNAIENFDTDMVLYFLHSYLYLTLQLSHITKNEKHYPVLLLSLWNFKRLRKKKKRKSRNKATKHFIITRR